MKTGSVLAGTRMAVLVGVALGCLVVGCQVLAQTPGQGPGQTPGRTLYVDGSLAFSCNTYSVALKKCSGRDGAAYPTIQAAADVVVPGDRVLIRGGVYPLTARVEALLLRSGTAAAPIRFEGYAAEEAIIRGVGYEEQDLDGDGFPDGPVDKGTRRFLLAVAGDFIEVRKLIVELAPFMGIRVDGSDNVLEEVTSRDNWSAGIAVRGARNRLRHVQAHHNRHGSGISIVPRTHGPEPSHNEISRSLSYLNGHDANDQRVRPVLGDAAGGGNSDGTGTGKICHVGALNRNVCIGERFVENIVWRNTDDGFDLSPVNSWIIGNVTIENGPTGRRGMKSLAGLPGQVFSGNLAIGLGVQYRAYEFRAVESLDVFHNFALNSTDRGVYIASALPAARMHNNLGHGNGGGDVSCGGGAAGCVNSHNWSTKTGDPRLKNIGAVLNLSLPLGSVQQRWQYVMDQVIAAYSPQRDSPLIDAGLLVPGFHCPLADDKGQDPAAACRHWMGAAPDIGPFEFGILGNPDKR